MKQKEHSDRKTELVQRATELVARQGYDSFSYADLVAPGLTKAAIHYHFPAKEDLGLAVLDVIGTSQQTLAQACVEQFGDAALIPLMQHMASRPWEDKICPLSSMQAEFNVLPAVMQARLKALSQREVATVADLLRSHAKHHGKRLSVPAEEGARLLLCAMKGSLLYGRTDGTPWTPKVTKRMLEWLFE